MGVRKEEHSPQSSPTLWVYLSVSVVGSPALLWAVAPYPCAGAGRVACEFIVEGVEEQESWETIGTN